MVLSINRYMASLRENAPRNRVEYAMWDDGDEVPEVSFESSPVPGKYRSTVSNILSKQCTEVKLISEDMIQTTSHVSKKKLKDLITKHNNELFSFMTNPDRISVLTSAETIFRRYGHDIPSIKGADRNTMLKDLQLD